MSQVLIEVEKKIGRITLNRPQALNALSLQMIRDLTVALVQFQNDSTIHAVTIRSQSKAGPFGILSAGGDIRFFHQAALSGNPALEDFFTEEYSLNHLIHHYSKPYIALMDGLVMGGGMGITQGAFCRIITENTKMAMPETLIGLFPDVGGGYFLSRCPGAIGEYLALTGHLLTGAEPLSVGLADWAIQSTSLPDFWNAVADINWADSSKALHQLKQQFDAHTLPSNASHGAWYDPRIETIFVLSDVNSMVQSLESHTDEWAQRCLLQLQQRSPLMLCVVLEQIRRGRTLNLAQNLQMERDMVRHCFYSEHLGRWGKASETVEGIRALAVDKDHKPQWNPTQLSEVTSSMVDGFFVSPWPHDAHPLRHLQN